jgi:AcrR family transcriptional regulator
MENFPRSRFSVFIYLGHLTKFIRSGKIVPVNKIGQLANFYKDAEVVFLATYSSGEQTRNALIQATGELAAEVGFDNVSTRAIATRAGENAGSIHYHFGGKENLFKAVLMQATLEMRERTIPEILAHFGPVLDTPEGQGKVVRALVHSIIHSFFGNDEPLWRCQVLFQVLRKESDLRDFLVKEVLIPFTAITESLFGRIRPGMSKEESFLHFLILTTPIYFHADYMDVILDIQGMELYSKGYVQKMEDIITRQTLLFFGLPDAAGERGERE